MDDLPSTSSSQKSDTVLPPGVRGGSNCRELLFPTGVAPNNPPKEDVVKASNIPLDGATFICVFVVEACPPDAADGKRRRTAGGRPFHFRFAAK